MKHGDHIVWPDGTRGRIENPHDTSFFRVHLESGGSIIRTVPELMHDGARLSKYVPLDNARDRYAVLVLVGGVTSGLPTVSHRWHGSGWGATFERWTTYNLSEARTVAQSLEAGAHGAYVVVLKRQGP